MDVTGAVKGAKGGSVEFRVEKAGIVQAGVGKASFSAEKLVQMARFLRTNEKLVRAIEAHVSALRLG